MNNTVGEELKRIDREQANDFLMGSQTSRFLQSSIAADLSFKVCVIMCDSENMCCIFLFLIKLPAACKVFAA